MTHTKRGIFSNPDLDAALEFVKHSRLNSSESFDVSVKKNSKNEFEVEIHSIPEEIREEEKKVKTRVLIPAGLYDMFW